MERYLVFSHIIILNCATFSTKIKAMKKLEKVNEEIEERIFEIR